MQLAVWLPVCSAVVPNVTLDFDIAYLREADKVSMLNRHAGRRRDLAQIDRSFASASSTDMVSFQCRDGTMPAKEQAFGPDYFNFLIPMYCDITLVSICVRCIQGIATCNLRLGSRSKKQRSKHGPNSYNVIAPIQSTYIA